MSVIAALLLSSMLQAGDDAKAFYEEMQKRIAPAAGVKWQYVTGYNNWDSEVNVIFEKPNRFSFTSKINRGFCDGKWYLETKDDGSIVHRRALPLDECYVPGFECLYKDQPPLAVFGQIEKTIKSEVERKPAWKIRYMRNGVEHSLLIDPATRLPEGCSLIPNGTPSSIAPVPSYKTSAEILSKADKALEDVKSALIIRTIVVKSPVADDDIWAFRGSKALVRRRAKGDLPPWSYQQETGEFDWNGDEKAVPIRLLGLRGLEAFTGEKIPHYIGPSYLSGFYCGVHDIQCWTLESAGDQPGQKIRTYFGDLSGMPTGYDVIQGNKVIKAVGYQFYVKNPKPGNVRVGLQ